MTEDVSYSADFATKVSYKNVRRTSKDGDDAFIYKLEGDNLHFKTSLSQWWFPEIAPIEFTPTLFRFHKGKG